MIIHEFKLQNTQNNAEAELKLCAPCDLCG